MKSKKSLRPRWAGLSQKRSAKSTRNIFLVIFLLTLLGLVVSVVLIRLHYQISMNPGEKSFCHISDLIDCDAALASPYAKLGPIFNAELGFGYYILFLCGMLAGWGSKRPLSILPFLLMGAAFSFIYSVVLNFISIGALGVICYPCLLIPIVNLTVLILIPMEMKIPTRELPGAIKQNIFLSAKTLFIPGIGALLIFGLGLVLARRLNPEARYSFGVSREAYLDDYYDLAQKEVLLPERTVFGNPGAKLTIVAFSDLQCPGCRRAESTLGPILEEYKERIRLIYLNYPPNPDCNPTARRTKHHLMACINAKQTLCASQLGKFSAYREWLSKDQTRHESLSKFSDELGIDRSAFENCLASKKTEVFLQEDIETATGFGVTGIPSIIINGRRFQDWRSRERLRLVLESELAQAAGP